MAPKKKEQQKMSLGDFLADSFGGGSSWADEVEETYVTGTQALPPSDRPRYNNNSSSSWQDRGFSVREAAPQQIPDKPPYTAHLGNLAYDVTNDAVNDFFTGCDVVSVRLIEDRELQRPKGFGYVEFASVEGLKQALALDGESFQGRTVRIKVADPPRGGDPGRGDSIRELGDWTRKGPLPDAPSRGGPREFGERRPPRDPASFESRPARELTWERHGPLAPLPAQEGSGSRDGSRPRPSPEGLGERSESYRGNRRDSPAWGEAREGGSRPPRAERPERPERAERVATAADKDMQWRDRMRPDAKPTSPDGSAPPSPALSNAGPAHGGRPRLNLQKRTVSEAPDAASPSLGSDAKASPFGAARPIDTAAREKEIEEKRQQAVQEKREADEKAKEERRIAKEAAAKAEAEAAEAAEKAEAEAAEAAAKAAAEPKEEPAAEAEAAEPANGEQKVPIRTREPREPREGAAPHPKSRAAESSSWRSASGEQRGFRGGPGPRGGRGGGRGARDSRPPRANGAAGQQSSGDAEAATPTADDDGWTTVPKKGRQGRAVP
ncbi:hypothetical protein CDV31_009843 [Fusarium ambrosium]|uniref:RRM domain-containing protein n=1 Tax=Fusarium ambrosium TaxID=131363 RepID=A0A428TS04_9HYPO|nr:hypothetical protein CDV31_009843 [Fusarium ambrosium]